MTGGFGLAPSLYHVKNLTSAGEAMPHPFDLTPAVVEPPTETEIPMTTLWHALIAGLQLIAGSDLSNGEDLVPFYKVIGWLAYCLREPLERVLGWRIADGDLQTGLPEYRNGGIRTRLGESGTKSNYRAATARRCDGSPARAAQPFGLEWRAMTVVLLDRTHLAIRTALPAPTLTLAQAFESATWAGRRDCRAAAPCEGGQGGGWPAD
ncbi:hypothetical protein DFH06DRAFT_1349083 [Mycena polygramma]|nr:hypothetical protein DFH06DRAFT_1349083 [Mycena polygramma]